MVLFLWDIDGTVLWTGGAGALAMTSAFEVLYGVPDAFGSMAFAGRTDPSLFREAVTRHGLAAGDFGAALAAFEEVYLRKLAVALGAADGRVLPGVPDVVHALDAVADTALGVATGNFRRGAELKLAHYGFGDCLADGGYGSDAEDRAELVAVAARRLAEDLQLERPWDATVVIGDSVLDVAAARANGFACAAVATGGTSAGQLAAAGADLVLPNLGDAPRAVTMLLALAQRSTAYNSRP
jgi:phosphoglycolate phosphatase-like HAD superfamily hydrolase